LKPEARVRVLGVIEAINLKNLGMYGVGNGMFEARHKSLAASDRQQAAGNRNSFDHGTALHWVTFSSMCYSEFSAWYAWVN